MLKLQQTRREENNNHMAPIHDYMLMLKPVEGGMEGWLMGEAFRVDWGWKDDSRELILREEAEEKKGSRGLTDVGVELHGEVVFVFVQSTGGMQPLKSSQ